MYFIYSSIAFMYTLLAPLFMNLDNHLVALTDPGWLNLITCSNLPIPLLYVLFLLSEYSLALLLTSTCPASAGIYEP